MSALVLDAFLDYRFLEQWFLKYFYFAGVNAALFATAFLSALLEV